MTWLLLLTWMTTGAHPTSGTITAGFGSREACDSAARQRTARMVEAFDRRTVFAGSCVRVHFPTPPS